MIGRLNIRSAAVLSVLGVVTATAPVVGGCSSSASNGTKNPSDAGMEAAEDAGDDGGNPADATKSDSGGDASDGGVDAATDAGADAGPTTYQCPYSWGPPGSDAAGTPVFCMAGQEVCVADVHNDGSITNPRCIAAACASDPMTCDATQFCGQSNVSVSYCCGPGQSEFDCQVP
jgi:hypothetical protein